MALAQWTKILIANIPAFIIYDQTVKIHLITLEDDDPTHMKHLAHLCIAAQPPKLQSDTDFT